MVYRSSNHRSDTRDIPKLIRMTPLRSSKNQIDPTNPTTPPSLRPNVFDYLDEERAKIIKERRLVRQRDIETVEKDILRNTGVKVNAPKLRNISEIRESVPPPPLKRIAPKVDNRGTVRVVLNQQEQNRMRNSMLASLKDLEKLRTATIIEECERITRRCAGSTLIPAPKVTTEDVVKAHSDMMKIQQMFQKSEDKEGNAKKKSAARPRKSYALDKIEEKGECSRLKVGNGTRAMRDETFYLNKSKAAGRNVVNGHRKNAEDEDKAKDVIRPQPPARKKRNPGNLLGSKDNAVIRDKVGPAETNKIKKASASEKLSEKPDILEGLLRESDWESADENSEGNGGGKLRKHWRGFVQSMRLHDVELHSDNEDQHRKGEFL